MGQEWTADRDDAEPHDGPHDRPHEDPIVDQRRIERFRQGAVGGVLAAGMLGLRDVIEGPKDNEVAIVETTSGDPPKRERIVMRLDPENPGDSIVMIRDWLPSD
jgi:hypothetical protein